MSGGYRHARGWGWDWRLLGCMNSLMLQWWKYSDAFLFAVNLFLHVNLLQVAYSDAASVISVAGTQQALVVAPQTT